MPRASARSMWTGSISFGLVNIPVKLFPAIREERVAFRMLHDQDKVPLQRRMFCPAENKEVHPEHIVKGYEIAPDQYVVVSEEELDAAAPKAARAIEIRDFVALEEIDPAYYDRPYYLAPGEHAAKPYRLLLEAMEKTGRVGIAQFVMRAKEYLAALRPVDGALCLDTMHFSGEVVNPEDLPGLPVEAKVEDRELKAAIQLIDSLTTKFDIEQYRDEYRHRVLEMVRQKAEGHEVFTPPPIAEPTKRLANLMEALEASLAKTKAGEAHGRGHKQVDRGEHRHVVKRRKSA